MLDSMVRSVCKTSDCLIYSLHHSRYLLGPPSLYQVFPLRYSSNHLNSINLISVDEIIICPTLLLYCQTSSTSGFFHFQLTSILLWLPGFAVPAVFLPPLPFPPYTISKFCKFFHSKVHFRVPPFHSHYLVQYLIFA